MYGDLITHIVNLLYIISYTIYRLLIINIVTAHINKLNTCTSRNIAIYTFKYEVYTSYCYV